MSESLKSTPLFDLHRAAGARMVPFAGFSMPVQYSSIVAEHHSVRRQAGLFDVSHMGQIHVSGTGAEASLEHLLTCPVASLRPGQVRYGCLCNEAGGVVDDVTVYRVSDDRFFVCVNAANIEKDFAWIEQNAKDCDVTDQSEATALLALQGPRAQRILDRWLGESTALKRFRFAEFDACNASILISRTGYTGADGFELYLPSESGPEAWETLMAAGSGDELVPVGLGARDTLRLEAAYPLYGHELTEETSPLEARLDRFVKLEAGGFIGHPAIRERAAAGHRKLLCGLSVEGRGIPRADYSITAKDEKIGYVTSGGPSPTLQKSIALAYLDSAHAGLGTEVDVVVRERAVRARVCKTPFV